MAVDEAAIRRAAYVSFLEPEPEHGSAPVVPDAYHDVPEGHPADVTKAELAKRFADDIELKLNLIGLLVDGAFVGNVTRDTVLAEESFAGTDMGGGDGLTFPLDSSEFRTLRFRCKVVYPKKCRRRAFAFYYDERNLPKCPDHQTDMVPAKN